MSDEELIALRQKLTELPKWPWHFVLAKDSNAVDTDIRIDVYSGEEVQTIKALDPKAVYKQIFHYHGQNFAASAAGIEWMKKNPKALETISFLTHAPELIDQFLKERGF